MNRKHRFFIGLLAAALVIATGTEAKSSNLKQEKKAVVLAVFGTSNPDALQSILNIQKKIETACPDIPVKMAFTSEIIRNIWNKRAGDADFRKNHKDIPDAVYGIKSPLATFGELYDAGYRRIAVQSTHIFAGEEYENLKAVIKALDGMHTLRERDKPFKKLLLGRPALGESGDIHPYEKDIEAAVKAVADDAAAAREKGAVLVYMGHGNEIFTTGAYVEFEARMRDAYPDVPVFVGAVEGFPGPERILAALKHARIKKVMLLPLMVVAGDHALNDMAGDEPDSWKNRFEKAGISVTPVLRGLGNLDSWADLYVQHLKDAMKDHNF